VCILAPALFCVANDWILGHISVKPEIHVGNTSFSDLDWKRRPGRPCNRWINQLRADTGRIPADLWRNAVQRSHGTATLRLQCMLHADDDELAVDQT